MQELKFTLQEVQAIANYLATKPYNEVAQLIGLIQSKTKDLKVEEPKEDKKK